MAVDPSAWTPLDRKDPEISGKLYSRLTILFGRDPFVTMLDPRVREGLANVLASEYTVHRYGAAAFVRIVLNKTAYSRLWSPEFMAHIAGLVDTALARPVTED